MLEYFKYKVKDRDREDHLNQVEFGEPAGISQYYYSHSLVYSLVSGHFFTEIGPCELCLTESPSDWLVGEIS